MKILPSPPILPKHHPRSPISQALKTETSINVCPKCGGFIADSVEDYNPYLGCECPFTIPKYSEETEDEGSEGFDEAEGSEECFY